MKRNLAESIEKNKQVVKIPKRIKIPIFGKCSICLESIIRKSAAHFLPCCHSYHRVCVDTWLEKNVTCPECRIPIFIQSHEQLESYHQFSDLQKNNPHIRRDNIQLNDNAISMRFLRNPTLFSVLELEPQDDAKVQALIHRRDPSLFELYSVLFSDSDFERDPTPDIESENEIGPILTIPARIRIVNTAQNTTVIIEDEEDEIEQEQEYLTLVYTSPTPSDLLTRNRIRTTSSIRLYIATPISIPSPMDFSEFLNPE